MPELSYMGQIYRLRAGSPMPVRGGDFVLHTFMAEVSDVEMIACTEVLPSSSDFRGQGCGGLISASFTRLNVKGGNVFSGKKVYEPRFVDEDELDNI